MKNSWISTLDKLPELHFISSDWYISEQVLVCVDDAFYFGYINIRDNVTEWCIVGKPLITNTKSDFEWQYLEKSDKIY